MHYIYILYFHFLHWASSLGKTNHYRNQNLTFLHYDIFQNLKLCPNADAVLLWSFGGLLCLAMSFDSLFWNRALETLVVLPWLPWYSRRRWWTFWIDELPPPGGFWLFEAPDVGPVFSLQYLLRLCLTGEMLIICLLDAAIWPPPAAWPGPAEIWVASDWSRILPSFLNGLLEAAYWCEC